MTAADLKASILDRAVRGLLVPQDPREGTAADLLASIARNGRARTPAAPLPVADEDAPFAIPEGWVWTTIKDVTSNFGQKTPDKKFCYIDVGSIDNNVGRLDDGENIVAPENAPSRAKKIVKNGAVLYSCVRPYLLNVCVVDRDFSHEVIASTAFAVLNPAPQLYNKYLFYYLRSPVFVEYTKTVATGQAYPAISDSNFYKGLIPLPPLAEQKRIVAKIEELMPLVEEYGKAESELAALNANFPDALRKSILQQAVAGLLLPKSSNWKEVKIKDIAKMYGGFAFKSAEYKKDGIQVVRISDLEDDGISKMDPVYYQESQDLVKYLVPNNAILICLTGSIGKMTWVKDNVKRYLNQRVGMLVFNDEGIIPYVWIFLHTPAVINSWMSAKTSTNGNIKNSNVTDLIIPLPPLAEQKEIVKRVEELLALVGEMK